MKSYWERKPYLTNVNSKNLMEITEEKKEVKNYNFFRIRPID
jgi:hypothetical protein